MSAIRSLFNLVVSLLPLPLPFVLCVFALGVPAQLAHAQPTPSSPAAPVPYGDQEDWDEICVEPRELNAEVPKPDGIAVPVRVPQGSLPASGVNRLYIVVEPTVYSPEGSYPACRGRISFPDLPPGVIATQASGAGFWAKGQAEADSDSLLPTFVRIGSYVLHGSDYLELVQGSCSVSYKLEPLQGNIWPGCFYGVSPEEYTVPRSALEAAIAAQAQERAKPQQLAVIPPGFGQEEFDPELIDGIFRVVGLAVSEYRDEQSCPSRLGVEVADVSASAVREHLGVVGIADFSYEKVTRVELAHHASWIGTYKVAASDGSMTLVEGSCLDVSGSSETLQYKATVLLRQTAVVVDDGTQAPPPPGDDDDAADDDDGGNEPPPPLARKPVSVGGQLFAAWAPALVGDTTPHRLAYLRFGGGLQIRQGVARLVFPYLRVGLHAQPDQGEDRPPLFEFGGGAGFGLSAPLNSAAKLDVQLAGLAGRGPIPTTCKGDGFLSSGERRFVCGDAQGAHAFPVVVQTFFWGIDAFVGASFGKPDGSVRFVLGALFSFEHHPLSTGTRELNLWYPEDGHEELSTVELLDLQLVRVQLGPLIRVEF